MTMENASINITPLSALTTILTAAVNTAEAWVDCLKLETFPRNSEDWDELCAHPAISDGWRWENWDEFIVDRSRCDFILDACKGCSEVEPLRARLEHAMMLINSFIEIAGEHTDEFCR